MALCRELQNLGLTPTDAIYRGQIKFDQDIQAGEGQRTA
jgi:hypothetical protein